MPLDRPFPSAFIERIRREVEEPEAFLASLSADPIKSFRTNYHKTEPSVLLKTLPGIQERIPWQEGAFYVDESFPFGRHPYHAAGLYYIQEASAMAPVVLLDPKPKERIIDLAAAPGGKSTQIAERIGENGLLVANDIDAERLDALTQNIERLGFTNVLITRAEPQYLAASWPEMFDRVLLDAPCSSEGVFRKQPEAIAHWSLHAIERACINQRLLLDAAARLLKPGGRLVYATCTFGISENEAMIAEFLRKHPEFEPEPLTVAERMRFHGSQKGLAVPSSPVSTAVQEATVRFFPHQSATEGQAMIRLKKIAPSSRPSYDHPSYTHHRKLNQRTVFKGSWPAIGAKTMPQEVRAAFIRFVEETLAISPVFKKHAAARLWWANDHLYLLPPALLEWSEGLKLLSGIPRISLRRAGLFLGTFRKNRFIPAHALALALSSSDLRNMRDAHVSLTIEEARSYLVGQSMTWDTLRFVQEHDDAHRYDGRVVILSLDGFPLGWGKVSNGLLKNHYPKGLRWFSS